MKVTNALSRIVMNVRARAFVADVRATLDSLPPRRGRLLTRVLDAHVGAGLQVCITAVDDAAVDALGAELRLDLPARVPHEGVSWYHATSGDDDADAAITVIGPRRKEERSGEGAQS